jgi:hypothetical protein
VRVLTRNFSAGSVAKPYVPFATKEFTTKAIDAFIKGILSLVKGKLLRSLEKATLTCEKRGFLAVKTILPLLKSLLTI